MRTWARIPGSRLPLNDLSVRELTKDGFSVLQHVTQLTPTTKPERMSEAAVHCRETSWTKYAMVRHTSEPDLRPVSFDPLDYPNGVWLAGDELDMCFDIYMLIFPENMTIFSFNQTYHGHESSMAREIMSEICSSISIVCLLATFVTYCLFSELRSLPGLNNMGLSLTLAAANLSLLVDWIRETGNQLVCISVGVGTHWLWLMALLWMGVSCVHMLRVFISKTRLTLNQSETKKTFVHYILFTLVISGCIVILTIVVSYAVSGGASLGYGGRLCLFDTDQHPFLPLALMLPLGLVVLTNMTCFIYTVFTIRRVQHLQAQTPKGFRDILVFAKLATVTGGTWTLAVVASLINKEWLLVVAELCTASQGLLVFLSFVCNRRVWNLYRARFRSFTKSATSSTSSAAGTMSSGETVSGN
ncbi:adhesion G protein-coupled receptor E3-like [Babylonia areolata]|uniref:adhesion G protein-coupled receptor E3-like n=1 Tax=Babylonia areolata TaxID=304850 RepID=UPI003FD1FE16